MVTTVTMCTQLRTLRTGSYASDIHDSSVGFVVVDDCGMYL